MAHEEISVIARFDDICRGFNYFMNDSCQEFEMFSRNQEACREKWLATEKECTGLKKELDESQANKEKLECQIRYITDLLKHEIHIRQKLQKEERDLERKLALVKQIVALDCNMAEDTRDKLVSISSMDSYLQHDLESSGQGVLDTASEVEGSTTRSVFSTLDFTQEQEDLEVTRVRSIRDVRFRRSCDFLHVPPAGHEAPRRPPRRSRAALNDDEGDVEDPCRDTVPRTATLTVSTTTPMMTTTTAASDRHGGGAEDDAREKFPGQLVRRTSSSVKRASRPHNFVSKVILKQESCVPCKNRIRFGKSALKCIDCLATCHVECKSSMPVPCVPTVRTPTHFVGTIADYSPNSSPMIPSIIVHCVNELEFRGLDESGLYRVNVLEREVHPLIEQLLQGKMRTDQLASINIHVVAGMVKSFLTSLKEPLVTYTMRDSLTRITYITDETDLQTTVCSLIPELPQPNRDTLAYLILHLKRVADSPHCRMPLSNLAKIFAPMVIGQPRIPLDNGLKKLQDLKEQQTTMEKLLNIPSDYWSCYGKYMETADTPVCKSKRYAKRAPFFPSPHF